MVLKKIIFIMGLGIVVLGVSSCKSNENEINSDVIMDSSMHSEVESESDDNVVNGVQLVNPDKPAEEYNGSMTMQEQADLEHMIDKIGNLTEE